MGLIPRALYAALDENVCQIHNYKCKIEVYTEALKSALRFEYALIFKVGCDVLIRHS